MLTEVIDNRLKGAGPAVRADRPARRRPRDRRHPGDRLALRRPAHQLDPSGHGDRLQPRRPGSSHGSNCRRDRLECGMLDPVRGSEFQREPRLIKGACVRRRLCQRLTAHPPGSPGSQLAPGTSAGWGTLRLASSVAVAITADRATRYGWRMGYTLINRDDPSIESFRGAFFKIRRALGTTAIGINEVRFPARHRRSRARRARYGPRGDLHRARGLRHVHDRRRGRSRRCR